MKHGEFIRQFASIQPSLYRYICSLLPNFGEAEDILQEVAVICWEKHQEFDESKSFQAWAFGIARNKVLHSKRRFLRTQNLLAKALEEKAEEYFTKHTLSYQEDQQDALQNCVEELDDQQKMILQFRYKEKFSSDAMAEKLKRSSQQIRTQLSRLRTVLKTCVTNRLMDKSE
jgi:RNA polymerase sigma-70 factor, ECF subfamily